jgi:hypothetical protein
LSHKGTSWRRGLLYPSVTSGVVPTWLELHRKRHPYLTAPTFTLFTHGKGKKKQPRK